MSEASQNNNEWFNVSKVYENSIVIEDTFKNGNSYTILDTCLAIIDNIACVGWGYKETPQTWAAIYDLSN